MLSSVLYTYLHLQQHEPALAIGAQLVARHGVAGNVLGEARTLADLAELCMLTGRDAEGMRYLARACLLLENTTRRNDCYVRALASCGDAAIAAGLHEVATARQTAASTSPPRSRPRWTVHDPVGAEPFVVRIHGYPRGARLAARAVGGHHFERGAMRRHVR